MTNVRFSVLVLPNVPWPELLRRCRHVEELGFDCVGLADHLVDWAGGSGPWFELWTQLAAIAMATSRVRIATLVAQIPLRNPVLFALQALTADHITGGRLEVGIGNWSNAERVARLREYVELVSRLMAGEEVTYAGRFYSADRARLQPGPMQTPRPPLMIAAMGKVMLGIAARQADIWNSLSFAKTFAEQMAETRERIAIVDERCAAIGRDPATLRRSYLMFDPSARGSGGRLSYYESEAAFEDMAGTVLALGVTEIALYYPMLERQAPVFERIARETIPRLRGKASGTCRPRP